MVDDDVEPEVLDGWIQVLLDAGVQAVNLINEENVTRLEIGEDARQVPRPFDLGSAGGVQA